jgi:thiamine biosynthesis lipoprotein
MGMPITIEIVDATATNEAFNKAFAFFEYIDTTFTPFKEDSEVSKFNRGELDSPSDDMRLILSLAEQTKQQTNGYFDVFHNSRFNPSGIVKGWAINEVAKLLRREGFRNFYVDAGGDIQVDGKNFRGEKWRVGIRNPFEPTQIVKMVCLTNGGIATSGLYNRGKHIYNPKDHTDQLDQVASITVIGENVYEADRFATAAFAMGTDGIYFIESLAGFEAYMIDKNGYATLTSGFTTFGTSN